MKVAGVIAEYNPFHSGHAYHLAKTRENADGVVCVLSGAFTQRGTPAIISKWERARSAVLCGADLVLELPFPFSAAPAEIFAFGGVDLLNKLGIVDILSFGSECGDAASLKNMADILLEKSREISESVKEKAGEGKTYASAVAQAVGDYTENTVLDNPNNLLGIKYIMALSRLGSDIKPFTVKREGSYNSTELEGEFVSAAALRKAASENNGDMAKYMPECAFDIFKTETDSGRIYDISFLSSLFTGIVRREGKDIEKYAYVAEGLENRFVSAAEKYSSIEEILDYVKTKRYTYSRLSRIVSAILVGMDKETLLENMKGGAGYARVLAANETGTGLIRDIKKKGNIEVISRGGDYVNLSPYGKKQFELEMRAGNIAALSCKNSKYRTANDDLLRTLYII